MTNTRITAEMLGSLQSYYLVVHRDSGNKNGVTALRPNFSTDALVPEKDLPENEGVLVAHSYLEFVTMLEELAKRNEDNVGPIFLSASDAAPLFVQLDDNSHNVHEDIQVVWERKPRAARLVF